MNGRVVLLAGLLALAAEGGQAPVYDLVLVGGRVVDGSGAPARRADVAINGGRIARVGIVPAADARDRIDATGLVIAPGFVDVHTHADDLAENPEAGNFVRMGVTTIVAGNCGSSALDVGEALTRIRQVGASVNFATLIGHNTVRREVMGTESRTPTIRELDRMKSLVWRAMTDGAVGFSTGLQYVPGTYARTLEIIELARVAGNAGGLYASHMRNEGTALEESVRETIRIGEAAGCRVQISHLKVDSPNRWGASVQALDIIDSARARGTQVQADQYAYTAASSTLGIRFPSWALEGGQEKIAERLKDGPTWNRIKDAMRALLAERGLADLSFAVVASHRADPSLNGLSMKQVAAKLKGAETADAQFEAARDMMLAGGASMVYHFMSDDDVHRIMRHPQVAFASDSSVLTPGRGVPHPRGYGNNARVLAEYVRVRKVIPLEEAVRKMTSVPAGHFRFAGRGLVKEGYAADLVLFDPATVADAATFDRPHAFPVGIPHVLVNGVFVVRNGEHTGARPGEVLRQPALQGR
ncbi:MAG TPA: D-aminoacylase [Vicinamibacterales bacterium]|nr:D-aminoacylase [Vicinamibacterales bacterium]